ncbi:MAG: hypothetical protein KUL83_04755 [Lentimicrobium sp.]|jgi:fructokinase|nr:hypothetical protein [Lentimicrobium sp.]MDD2529123.1 PfkB family carbohydrate kinase [Lentimicrobiaceae bacterium]MDD4598850.1 PfkB family carbohydrate kinase [Lentimicrobiaceae bacterium]MDY0026656.1 PfkB family carbohydrate kinase [Lentimicrobium sp.]HAH57400.1 hypothetical protein [Bacteroidales bacterium]
MVFVFGSCLYEIMFKNSRPEWAGPGGSALNASVSMARSGIPVYLITELANDFPAQHITGFLKQQGVSYTDYRYDGNTRLSLAFLNDSGDAQYAFYPGYPEKALKLNFPEMKRNDVALFGSRYSLQERNRKNVDAFIAKAQKAGAFIVFDPNYRKTADTIQHQTRLQQIIKQVNLVRASNDDMYGIAGTQTGTEAYKFVREAGCPNLIYTSNSGPVELFTPDNHCVFPVKPVVVVSTIGAGDAFNAGLISYIHQNKNIEQNFEFWNKAIERGLIFATNVCGSHENYINGPV